MRCNKDTYNQNWRRDNIFRIEKFDFHLISHRICGKFLFLIPVLMICYSIRKEGESSEKLLMRYKKSFFQTRTANKLKGEQNHTRDLSKRKIREQAIIREYYRALSKKV